MNQAAARLPGFGLLLLIWTVRGSILLGILFALAAPTPQRRTDSTIDDRVSLDPPQTVETVDSRVCVHTRLTDEVEETKIQQTLRLVREMGATWVVDFFPWSYVQPTPGEFDWTHHDIRIKHAENQGLRIIARLGLVPAWARDDGSGRTTPNYLPEDRYDDFARFVRAFVERYEGRVSHIIIWNEPNLNFEWGERPADPVAYTRLLQIAYEAAHAANPDIVVLGGALAPTLEPAGEAGAGWNDIDYLTQMYEAGAADAFDMLAVHNYGLISPPDDTPAPDILNFRRIELLREVMENYGDGHKPVMITETGWNDAPQYPYRVSPEQRISYTLEAFGFTAAAYPWLEALCVWQFRLPAPTQGYRDYFTLVSSEFDRKPIYFALQAYAKGEELPSW